jgi:carbohydrate-binding DOMON domain-containing protein
MCLIIILCMASLSIFFINFSLLFFKISNNWPIIIKYYNKAITVKFEPPESSDVFLRLLSIIHNATVFYIATVHYMKDKVYGIPK